MLSFYMRIEHLCRATFSSEAAYVAASTAFKPSPVVLNDGRGAHVLIDHLVFYAIGASVGILFGIHDVAIRSSRSSMDARDMTLATLISGYPVVILFSTIFWGFREINIESVALYVMAGLMNFSVGRSSLYVAIRSVGASGASILLTLSIVIGMILGVATGEKVSLTQSIGAGLILAASIMIAWGEKIKRDPRGIAAGLVASLGLALAIFLSRLGNISGGDPFAGAFIAYTTGIAFEILVSRRTRIPGFLSRDSIPIHVAGVLASLAQVARYVALTQLGAGIVTPLQNIRPVVATTLARVFAKRTSEDPGLRGYVAAMLAFAGVFVMSI